MKFFYRSEWTEGAELPSYYNMDELVLQGESMNLFYDMDGKPTEDMPEDTQVAETETRHYRISTVLLSVDHNLSGRGLPVIFETMVFKKGDWEDLDMNRYCTKKQALAGHAAMVKKWKHGKPKEKA